MGRFRLSKRDTRIVAYCIGLSTCVGLLTVGYWMGMAQLEGRSISVVHALLIIIETLTTTGYGADAPWVTDQMKLYMAFVQVSGIIIGFVALRVLVIPLFESTELHINDNFEPQTNHVLVCEYDRDIDALLAEFDNIGQPYVLIIDDEQAAKEFHRDGVPVVHGQAEDPEMLQMAGIHEATTVITDAGRRNAEILLTIDSLDPDATVLCLSDNPQNAQAYEHVGADSVISPQHLLGHTLGIRATSKGTRTLSTSADLAGDAVLVECDVQDGSPLDGSTIASNQITQTTEAKILGLWKDGSLEVPPPEDSRITSDSILSVLTTREDLEHVQELTTDPNHAERVVIAGLGIVGSAAYDVLETHNIPTTTIDTDPTTNPNTIGDVTDISTLQSAGIEDAGTLVVAVNDDSSALLTIALARTLNPNIDIFARLTNANTTDRARQAGADYAVSLPQISARIAARVIRGEEILALTQQSRLVRTPATEYGSTITEVQNALQKTNKTVLVVEHDGQVWLPDEIEELTEKSTLLLSTPEL